jgi:3-oxoacyl-[acyl-carrier-protein] synthase-3
MSSDRTNPGAAAGAVPGSSPAADRATIHGARITGTGSAFPERRVGNDELAARLDVNDAWIRERTGIRERRLAVEGNPADWNSALGHAASLRALEAAGRTADDIDQIIYATSSPETLMPSTACWLQHRLGARRAWAMDVNGVCSGFVYALATAEQFIRSGRSKCVLVVGGDLLSTQVNWSDRNSAILFGDGAGAIVLERTDIDDPHRVLTTHLGSDGALVDLLYVPAGGSRLEVTPERYQQQLHKMQMKGREIFRVAVKTMSDYSLLALDAARLNLDEIDWFVPHQANLRIIEAVAARLSFPMEKCLINLDRYGNTSAATVPTALDEGIRDGRVKPGHTVLFAVFGAGLTYGSAIVRM